MKLKHKNVILAVVVTGIVVVAAAVLATTQVSKTVSAVYCEKSQDQIGNCAQLVSSSSRVGLNAASYVYVVPTNTGEAPNGITDLTTFNGRYFKYKVDNSCADNFSSARWANDAFVITKADTEECVVSKQSIGNW